MQIEKIIHTIDTHTGGESTRVVIHGYPALPRTDPQAITKLLAAEYDSLRRMLLWEPRGHKDMFGALLLPPSQPDTRLGVVFMHTGGYLPMCVHGLMGAVVAAVESGYVTENDSNKPLKVETPVGIVQVRFARKAGVGLEVTVRNVTCFAVEFDLEVKVGEQRVRVDVAYGGNFFALVEASALGLSVDTRYVPELRRAGMAIRRAVNEQKKFTHPEQPDITGVELVEISEEARNSRAHARNVVVFGPGQIDRSPCGTGTGAKMALLYSRGKLQLGQKFLHESILGTIFSGQLVEEQQVGPFRGVVPEITGTAFITAIQQFVADPLDPLREGFLLDSESHFTPTTSH